MPDDQPILFASLASIPQRMHLVNKVVKSLAAQTYPPERILLCIPDNFTRWPGITANRSLIHPHRLLEIQR